MSDTEINKKIVYILLIDNILLPIIIKVIDMKYINTEVLSNNIL